MASGFGKNLLKKQTSINKQINEKTKSFMGSGRSKLTNSEAQNNSKMKNGKMDERGLGKSDNGHSDKKRVNRPVN